jgi:hypothetical protein
MSLIAKPGQKKSNLPTFFTASDFFDLVDLKLTCFGNHQLVIHPALDGAASIFAGNVNIFNCVKHDAMTEDYYTLKCLRARLKSLSKKDFASALHIKSDVECPFNIGFNTRADGFSVVVSSHVFQHKKIKGNTLRHS